MNSASLFLLLALALAFLGAVLAALLPDDKRQTLVLAWLGALAAALLLVGSAVVLTSNQTVSVSLWSLPAWGPLSFHVGPLSALFMFISAVIYLPVAVFSARYLQRYADRYSLRSFAIFYHALFISVVLVLIASDVVSLLLAWESMSILSYLLVNFEHERSATTRAGYQMLAMGELGTLAVVVGLLLLAIAAHGSSFTALRALADPGGGLRWAVFLLTFFGFGVKAGLLPSSSWLPRAHPASTSNVSALLSGVILNLGIYGIVRVNASLLPMALVGPGAVVLVVGALSALMGILYATVDNDIKRMLAHSSIENMGIITTGLGASFIFSATAHPVLAGIAMIAAFYHMFNHSMYKALLFLGAGAVDSSTGRRDMNVLGGLIRTMPWTGLLFLVGSLSIAALPPFSGFMSEWLTLQSLLRSTELASRGLQVLFALSGALLALASALAITCFVKAFAMSFLGMARSRRAQQAREVSRWMLAPMGFLAVGSLLSGVLPSYVIPQLDRVTRTLTHASAVDALVPPFFAPTGRLPKGFVAQFHDLGAQLGQSVLPGRGLVVMHRGGTANPVVFASSMSYALVVLLVFLGLVYLIVRVLSRRRRQRRAPRWDGGLQRLLPEMTYTATGFSSPVRVIFATLLHPTETNVRIERAAAHFRTAIIHRGRHQYFLDRALVRPVISGSRRLARMLARMHHGRLNAYVAYVLLTLVVLLILGLVL